MAPFDPIQTWEQIFAVKHSPHANDVVSLPSRAIDIRTIGRHPLASVGSFQPSRIVNIAVALRGHSEWEPGGIVLSR
jgi:hypothetical protein